MSTLSRTTDAIGVPKSRWMLLGTAAALVALVLVGLGGCRAGAVRGEILYADALEHLARGDSTTARALLQEARYEMPREGRVLFQLGKLLAAEGTIEARARAEQLFRRAIEMDPDAGPYREALGELLHRQGFHRQSLGALRTALRIDPNLGRAWFFLGLHAQREYLEDPGSKALRDTTIHCYERAIAIDPEHLDLRYRLAVLRMVRGDLLRARSLVDRVFESPEAPLRFGLLRTAIEFRARRFERAQKALDTVLARMSDSERRRLFDLETLLHPDSVSVYRFLTQVERDSIRDVFWWDRDPTPTTMANERLIEHVARVVDADFYFEVPYRDLLGRDTDRGEIYVRYGPPTDSFRATRSRSPAWIWTYSATEGFEMSFVFLDRLLNGNYVRVRRGVGSNYTEHGFLEAFPEVTALHLAPKPSEWRYALRFFRGREDHTAVEVAYEVELDTRVERIVFEAAGWQGPGRLLTRETVEVLREDLHALGNGRAVGRLRLEVPPGTHTVGLGSTAHRKRLLPGLPAASPLWHASSRESIDPVRFDEQTLGLSDLMLAYEVGEGEGGPFDMGGILAVPRVESEIRGSLLHLYFEIYVPESLLKDTPSIAVTYRVEALPPEKWTFWDQFRSEYHKRFESVPVVESTFTVQPRRGVEPRYLTIDIQNLEPGLYRLAVQLRGPSGVSTPQSTARFSIPRSARSHG